MFNIILNYLSLALLTESKHHRNNEFTLKPVSTVKPVSPIKPISNIQTSKLTSGKLEDYDYQLVVQKCNPTSDYSIHGLWIDYKNGGWPEFCQTNTYDESKLDFIKDSLHKVWPTCKPDKLHTDSNFWQHEWDKHGTCFPTSAHLTQYQYFTKTIGFFDSIKNDLPKLCNNVKKGDCRIPVNVFNKCNKHNSCQVKIGLK